MTELLIVDIRDAPGPGPGARAGARMWPGLGPELYLILSQFRPTNMSKIDQSTLVLARHKTLLSPYFQFSEHFI